MNSWHVMQPWWLVLPFLALPALFLQPRRSNSLPGGWAKIIEPGMVQYLRRWLPAEMPYSTRFLRWLLISFIAVALADVSLGSADTLPKRALHARALVIDISALGSSSSQLFTARQMVRRAPDIPTAIIAATARAYDVVPLTTDPEQLDRYLQVLDPQLMPDTGRSPINGIKRADNMLQAAGILAGQIVLLSTASKPAPQPASDFVSGQATVWVLLDASPDASWQTYAESLNAQIKVAPQIDSLDSALLKRRDRTVLANTPLQERRSLTPWLTLASLPLWLILFFRRRDV